MNLPSFTTNPERIARLQENYDIGVSRERIPAEIRDQLDHELLKVSNEKLRFLFQNALESYSPQMKNQKIRDFNAHHASKIEKDLHLKYRFL